ncbi:Cof-type HAD-IIB family hydrolase [Pediococcus claussenii]|uniref:HAD hydrolase, IIB family protein n=1 Tax=Pediococcus claussenii (strain ATCC BAA-344 / DSM 14800 / JCM 18046 / KCTC 3811 / LMG 21948 / P06) TaxID=701521 RepID=G8PAD6_PEDCP|nr:Cof-type HAD-IIB family hydrolase [Pediococcus claussenii]AEV95725.1 HAD hydrolase, IIB family protein [Pediococcus claussenii ATCC BAA-344]ANZ69233.1 hydrolase [Pediococcus claussenii]ANZ71052.1 hydrolase [Pediococcus claussenii]KRN20041.1 hypothetical protein IV79_GL000704 [Pediococcus claussenii]
MSIKLVAIDIDDTLLNSDHAITDKTVSTIKRAIQQGTHIVLCTGRPLAGVAEYLKQLEIDGDNQYVITYNGALSQSVDGKILKSHILNLDDFKRIKNFCDRNNVQFNVLDDQSNIYTTNHSINRFTVVQAYENFAGIQQIESIAELASDFVMTKAVLVGEIDQINLVENQFKIDFANQYYQIRSTPNFFEILNKNANKGNALQDLRRYLHLDLSEVMSIGDERNDLTMFENSGTSVAMGNSSDFIKKHTDLVTTDNDHDGVAEAIEKFVLNH